MRYNGSELACGRVSGKGEYPNLTARDAIDNSVELMVERFNKRLARCEACLTWRMFLFCVGQVAAVAGLLAVVLPSHLQ